MQRSLINTPAKSPFNDSSFAVNFQSQTNPFPKQRATVGNTYYSKIQPQLNQLLFAREKSVKKQDEIATVKHRETFDKQTSVSPNLTKSAFSKKIKILIDMPVKFTGFRQKGVSLANQDTSGSKRLQSSLLSELKKESCDLPFSSLTPNNKKFEVKKIYQNQIQGNVYSTKKEFDRKVESGTPVKESTTRNSANVVIEKIRCIGKDNQQKNQCFFTNFVIPIFKQIQIFKNSISEKKCLNRPCQKKWKQKLLVRVDFLNKQSKSAGIYAIYEFANQRLIKAFAKLRET